MPNRRGCIVSRPLISSGWVGALGTAFILTVLKPERGTFALALALRLGMTAHQAPMQFDSPLWKAQTDLATLLALAVRQRERVLDGCGWVIVGQMALFYLASGFWKIETFHKYQYYHFLLNSSQVSFR